MKTEVDEAIGAVLESASFIMGPFVKKFDISPFALPNCPPGEFWFEESRDIHEVVLQFRDTLPRQIGVRYLQDKWLSWQNYRTCAGCIRTARCTLNWLKALS